MPQSPEFPYFGLPRKKPDKSKKSEYDSGLYLKDLGRQLLIKDDDIDEYTLTKHEKEMLTMNHEISMAFKPTDVLLTEQGGDLKDITI
jgi:hypothetical protein